MGSLSWLSPLFFAVSFFCFVGDVDHLGWVLANASGFFSLWTPAIGWLIKGHVWPGLTSMYLRLGLVVYAGYGWWTFGYQPPSDKGGLFLFGLIPFLAGLQWLEIRLIERYVPESSTSQATDESTNAPTEPIDETGTKK